MIPTYVYNDDTTQGVGEQDVADPELGLQWSLHEHLCIVRTACPEP